jgi:hypothetical protein
LAGTELPDETLPSSSPDDSKFTVNSPYYRPGPRILVARARARALALTATWEFNLLEEYS